MMKQSPCFKQVELLVRVLPVAGRQKCFALKGGTAINLFYRDLPRLSVDIDLVYLPLKNRNDSLEEISQCMEAIGTDIVKLLPGTRVNYSRLAGNIHVICLT